VPSRRPARMVAYFWCPTFLGGCPTFHLKLHFSPHPPLSGQSLASTKFRRDGSHFAIVWAIRAGIGRIRLAHTKAFVRALQVQQGGIKVDKALVESLPSLTHALMERHFMSFVHTIFHFNELHDSILRFDERKCVPVHVLSPYTDPYPHLCPPVGPAKSNSCWDRHWQTS